MFFHGSSSSKWFHSLDLASVPANGCWFRSRLHEPGVWYSKLGNLPSANTGYYALIKNSSNFWTHKDMKIVQETTISMDYWCDRARVNQQAPMMDDCHLSNITIFIKKPLQQCLKKNSIFHVFYIFQIHRTLFLVTLRRETSRTILDFWRDARLRG